MPSTIHHGDNRECPQVQSGEWKYCKGHEQKDGPWPHKVTGPDLFYCPQCRYVSNVPVFCMCHPDRTRVLPVALAQRP